MTDLLYLDTARLGRMSPTARTAHHAFTDLAGAEGGSAYFERFLRSGLGALPHDLQDRYPGLIDWRGVAPLKASLRRLAGGGEELPVLLANRSAQLMKLAARALFNICRNVLVTDLDWPSYREILQAGCRRANRTVTVVPVRRFIADGIGEADLVERIAAEFGTGGCDGLFLTAVSSDGIRLPVGPIVRRVESAHRLWFAAVDGAQDYCHVGADLGCCDLYLTGAHKWLGAYQPLGIGLYGRRRSKGRIESAIAAMAECGDLDDPLLRFADRLESGTVNLSETVGLAPLFSCQGAATDALAAMASEARGPALANRLGNLEYASELTDGTDWRSALPDAAFRSGILVLRNGETQSGGHSADALRLAFREHGVALSAYPGGSIRLSMPASALTPDERGILRTALRTVATAKT